MIGVAGDVGDVVGPVNDPVRVDEVGVAARKAGEFVAGISSDFVRNRNAVIGVAQQLKGELLAVSEGSIFVGRVIGRAEDGHTEFGESFGPVTQSLALDDSTRRGGLRVPPHQDPATGQIRQLHGGSVLVEEFELGCLLSGSQHHPILPRRDTWSGG